jgi:hypothetical protein
MKIDDNIVLKYLSGQAPESYRDSWMYDAVGRGRMFEPPDPLHKEWVAELRDKLITQIKGFTPRNYTWVKKFFPSIDQCVDEYTIILTVGFPDPYDAMTLTHDGTEYMVFDLIQFGRGALDGDYHCSRVLTHELIHLCLHQQYAEPRHATYIENLDYIAFDEGFAHALSYPESMTDFQFTRFLAEKYGQAKEMLKKALAETHPEKQKSYLVSADTGDYWDKFASISGKLYLLNNIDQMEAIYNGGWYGFANKIIQDQ